MSLNAAQWRIAAGRYKAVIGWWLVGGTKVACRA